MRSPGRVQSSKRRRSFPSIQTGIRPLCLPWRLQTSRLQQIRQQDTSTSMAPYLLPSNWCGGRQWYYESGILSSSLGVYTTPMAGLSPRRNHRLLANPSPTLHQQLPRSHDPHRYSSRPVPVQTNQKRVYTRLHKGSSIAIIMVFSTATSSKTSAINDPRQSRNYTIWCLHGPIMKSKKMSASQSTSKITIATNGLMIIEAKVPQLDQSKK